MVLILRRRLCSSTGTHMLPNNCTVSTIFLRPGNDSVLPLRAATNDNYNYRLTVEIIVETVWSIQVKPVDIFNQKIYTIQRGRKFAHWKRLKLQIVLLFLVEEWLISWATCSFSVDHFIQKSPNGFSTSWIFPVVRTVWREQKMHWHF